MSSAGRVGRVASVVIASALAAQIARAQSPTAPCTARANAPALDHTVIVVRDLDTAAAAFRRLGFSIKAGRLHTNNLLNRHIKFRDGSEIELMSVQGQPGDEMAQNYSRLLQDGEGGVYVALTVRSIADVQRVADRLSLATRRSQSGSWQFLSFPSSSPGAAVFFGAGDFRVNDADSVLTHSPSVHGLAEVWLEGGPQLGTLLAQLGAARCENVRAPDGRMGQRWLLSRGSIVLVPARSATRPRVLGAVLATPDSAARTVFPLPNFWLQYHRTH
jgi:hypothetical protein